ncbi:unnamed protein product [Durusdinium trenchii]|uniref:Uncharacterized protein n=1 Tax=Durusdinium trenchii TaxID=1381693 RepID=A0ABP0PU85_9DINO
MLSFVFNISSALDASVFKSSLQHSRWPLTAATNRGVLPQKSCFNGSALLPSKCLRVSRSSWKAACARHAVAGRALVQPALVLAPSARSQHPPPSASPTGSSAESVDMDIGSRRAEAGACSLSQRTQKRHSKTLSPG